MKLFDKKSLILLISVISINLLCIISVSYAYFTAQIVGNDKAQDMVVKAGTMEITYYDSNEISLNSMLPGDSLIKKFKIVNTGTLATKYNIKLIVEENDFIDKQDLVVTLKRNDKEDNVTNIVPVKEDGYILINEPMELKGEHDYTLTLTFKKDLEDTNQNDNVNKAVKFKIGVDSNTDAEIYEYSYDKDNTFYSKLKEAELNNNAAYDDFGNIRYIGKDPNNYIWFNCDDYENLTNENATDEKHNCEKWRIIGDFKDTLKSDGTREDLIKIIRADSLGAIAWDKTRNNNWTNASLQKGLNGPYLNNADKGDWITAPEYTSSSFMNKKNENYKGITSQTKSIIEQVIWNLGASYSENVTTSQIYSEERGSVNFCTYRSCTTPTTWVGYIGLIYASDYGYATSGGTEAYNRQRCLDTELFLWWVADNRDADVCFQNDWLFYNEPGVEPRIWTLTPNIASTTAVLTVDIVGREGSAWGDNTWKVIPVLYLKSNIKIASGNGGTEPYILTQ